MSQPRILFVDDEPNVLEGLQDALRRQRRAWEMVYALGPAAADAELAKGPFDIVVSDMRMPGMDGAALLKRVKELHPQTARIILSGHSDQEASIRSLAVAHRFLGKPFHSGALQQLLADTLALQALLADPELRELAGGLEHIPSPPKVYSELLEVAGKPDSSLPDVAKVIERDPAMSAKMLQIVNSAYFGLAQPTTSIARAVGYLGLEIVKGLALLAHVFARASARVAGLSLDALQEHALRCAQLARRLVDDPKHADAAFMAGLLHDVGTIVLATGDRERFARVLAAAAARNAPLHECERELLGRTHAEVGAYLLGYWGLPHAIVEAVAYHHRPGAIAHDAVDVLAAVHVADALIDLPCLPRDRGNRELGVDLDFLRACGREQRLAEWTAIADEQLAGGCAAR